MLWCLSGVWNWGWIFQLVRRGGSGGAGKGGTARTQMDDRCYYPRSPHLQLCRKGLGVGAEKRCGVNYCTDLLFLNMYCVGGYFEAEGRSGVCASVPSLTVVHVPFMYTSFPALV